VAAGATVVAVGRDQQRLDELAGELGDRLIVEVVDLADLEQTAALADRLAAQHDELAAIVHNAGALLADRRESPQGIELTVAVQVVSPFLLTHRLLDRLASPGRVLTMSSGGMYSAPVEVERLQLPEDDYDGTRQYALAKRAQVTLNEMWAVRTDPGRAVFHATHPGWADTPGVADALPTFRRIVGPALRTPDQGADTLVWLTLDEAGAESTGGFWLDRRRRPIHRLRSTRRSDTPAAREQLWEWVASAAGVSR